MRWGFVRREGESDLYALMACDKVVKVLCLHICGASAWACVDDVELGLIDCTTF
jgi:hypothetical protein